jgi:hypothetical protein
MYEGFTGGCMNFPGTKAESIRGVVGRLAAVASESRTLVSDPYGAGTGLSCQRDAG